MKSEQGQTLVEFALILPILLLLVIGIYDFGSAFNQKNNLTFLANTAARYAEVDSCVPCGGQTIASYVQQTAVGFSSPPTVMFCLPSGSTGAVGDPLQVSTSASFTWLAVKIPGLPTGSSPLGATVTVRILDAPSSSDPVFGSKPIPAC